MANGPRIYNLFPLLCGSVRQWEDHLPRIKAMGFDWVYLNPFHYPGFSGSLYAVKDYYRIHDLMWDGEHSLEDLLKSFCWKAGELGLSVIMDLVINHTSKDSLLAETHPDWFLHNPDGSFLSPSAIDPADSRKVTVWGDLAEIDYHDPSKRGALTNYFGEMIGHFVDCGFRGFRCDAAYLVPTDVWSKLIAFARFKRHDTVFFAETLGCRLEQIAALRSGGFDYLFNSAKWWDFKSPWLLDQYDQFRRIAPSVSFPESHDTDRVAKDLEISGNSDPALIERAYRMRYLFSAVFSSGVMIPVGYEYGFKKKLNVVNTRPDQWEQPLFDIKEYIAAVNYMRDRISVLNEEGPQRRVDLGDPNVLCLLRRAHSGPDWVLSVINTDLTHPRGVRIEKLDSNDAVGREVTPGREGGTLRIGDVLTLAPCEARVFVNA